MAQINDCQRFDLLDIKNSNGTFIDLGAKSSKDVLLLVDKLLEE